MRVLFTLLTLFLLAGLASAQHVCRGRNVAAVVVPSYHVAPVKAVAVHHDYHAVRAVKVIAQPDYYYSVSDGYRDSLLADAIAFRLLQLQQKGLLKADAATPPTPRYKEPAEGSVGTPPAVPRAGPPAPAALAAVVEAKCAKCHQNANGIDLSDLDRVPEGARWKSYGLVNSGVMPKGAKPVPDDEVKLFYDWATAAQRK